LLTQGLGIDHKATSDIDEFYAYPLPKINYSDLVPPDALNIKPHAILFDHGIRDYHLQVNSHPDFEKIFFKNSNNPVCFDIFGAAFWLLSRYEEYLPHKADEENRFHFKSGLAYQYDFLHKPLVNIWLEAFRKELLKQFPLLEFNKREYRFLSTIDIDNVYKYKHKGFVRTIAGFVSDGTLEKMKQRLRIILGREQDPFDCYEFLIKTHRELRIDAIYFFLLGDYGPNDKNHSALDLRFQSLIKHLADYSMVGIHPSYGSNNNLRQLKTEVSRLGNITHKLITKTRQHFSMLRFPQTYKDLLQAGMTADYSMGYKNRNGFRASYCYPYKWYSLDIESVSSLTIHSYCINDNTLMSEAALNKKTILETASPYIDEIKKYRGELITIFHNDNFTSDIRQMYRELLLAARA